MLKNYIRIAFRNIIKNKVFSFVNVFGLAIGIAAFLLIIHYVRFERSYEDFHTNIENLYRITLDSYNNGVYEVTDCETHSPLGPTLKREFPEVVDFLRMYRNDRLINVKIGANQYREEATYYTDPSILNMLTFDIIDGKADKAMTRPFETMISASAAKKYFNRTDVAGESITIDGSPHRIALVFHDLPPNTHLKFNLLISHSTIKQLHSQFDEESWNTNNEYTYILTKPNLDLADFNKKLTAMGERMKDKIGTSRFTAEAMKSIHLYSNKTYEPEVNGSIRIVNFLMIIALFIVIIAWVNYINLATARVMERSREVGIRKVMGSLKQQLIIQFMAEAMLVNVGAGIIALGIFQVSLPLFRELTGQPLPVALTQSQSFWLIFAGIIGGGSILSGLYPAFVLSSFQPAAVLKGKFRSSIHGQRLRKGLVVFQFGATMILIIAMSTVYLQVNHLQKLDLGMKLDQVLIINAPGSETNDSLSNLAFHAFQTELLRHKDITKVASSGSIPGASLNELSSTSITRIGHEDPVDNGFGHYFFSVDANFLPTLDMKLIAGRNFDAGAPNDDRVIINEESVHRLGFKNPAEAIGSKISFQTRWPGEPATIIGVMKNFHQRSPKEAHLPMLVYHQATNGYIEVKIASDDMHETIEAVKQTWNKVFPGALFSHFFMDESYNQQFQSDVLFGRVMAVFSCLAVLIASMGLFGLSSYTIVQRTKEIGIRKVLGASVVQIVKLLSKDFARVIVIATVIALPTAYVVTDHWLSNYAIRIDLSVSIFLIPVAVVFTIAMITVSVQTIRTAITNPTNALKQE